MRVVVAPDKFRGTATANDVAGAIASAVARLGGHADELPVADGGEGTLEALGGSNRCTTVDGPLGDPVGADWRLSGRDAVVEMAKASGLALVGGADHNDPIGASTYGTGQLIDEAIDRGARRIIVGVGGSATTDGGLGALRALYPLQRLRGLELQVACDVRTRFVDAAPVFGPQKGATPAQVEFLRRRLERLADVYLEEHGVDVRELAGAGAAGGLAGGMAAIGAELVAGFDLVADEIGLYDAIEGADLVITGEGYLDDQSFDGKAVGGVARLAEGAGVPIVAVVGDGDPEALARIPSVSLTDRFGAERSLHDTIGCLQVAVEDYLRSL